MVPNDLSANDLVTLDDEVIATNPQISNEDIIDEFRKSQDDEAEDDDSDMEDDSFDIVVDKPSKSKVECSIDVLKDLAMCCEKCLSPNSKKRIMKTEKLTKIGFFRKKRIFNLQCIGS